SASSHSLPRDENNPAQGLQAATKHRSQEEVGPFTLVLRLPQLPDQKPAALPCTAAMDEELARDLASIQQNEAVLRGSRDTSSEIDSAIDAGLRSGVIEIGGHRIAVGSVKPEHEAFLKNRLRESLVQALGEDIQRLTRLIDDQRETYDRRVKVRNEAIPLCQSVDLLEQTGYGVQRFGPTDTSVADAAARFGGGRWSFERQHLGASGPTEHYRLEATSVGWERPPGSIDWELPGVRGHSDYGTVLVEALRVDAAQRERLSQLFTSF